MLLLEHRLAVIGHAGSQQNAVHLFGQIRHGGRRRDDNHALAFQLVIHSIVAVPEFPANDVVAHRKAERLLHRRLVHVQWNYERKSVQRRSRDGLCILCHHLCLRLPKVNREPHRDMLVERNVVNQHCAAERRLVL